MGTITSANASVILQVPDVFPIGQFLQGFAADDAFIHESFDMAETRMGVDGFLSGGFTPNIKKWAVTFQPDSPSIAVFDLWGASEEAATEKFIAGLEIAMPSIGKQFTFKVGFLKGFKKLPDAKKVLEPQTYSIDWQSIITLPL
jgi:hypothetical protein